MLLTGKNGVTNLFIVRSERVLFTVSTYILTCAWKDNFIFFTVSAGWTEWEVRVMSVRLTILCNDRTLTHVYEFMAINRKQESPRKSCNLRSWTYA